MAVYTRPAAMLLVLFLCINLLPASARQSDSAGRDTARQDFLSRVRKIGRDETISSRDKYQAGRIAMHQEQLLQALKYTSQHAKLFLNKGIDTMDVRKYLQLTAKELAIADEGVFVNKGSGHSQRNLAATEAVLKELLIRTNQRNAVLNSHIGKMNGFIDRIDSLSTDSALYTFPQDSAHTLKYLRRMGLLVKELGPVDTALRSSIGHLQELQTEVDIMAFSISSRIEEVEKLHDALEAQTFEQEFPYIWQPAKFNRPVREILQFSFAKEKLAFRFYVAEQTGRLLIVLLLILAASYFLHSLKQKLLEEKSITEGEKVHAVLRYTPLSAIVVVVCIFQFIFFDPPYVWGFSLWIIAAISLALLFRGYITRFWFRFWCTTLVLFLLAGACNMILQPSRLERWCMLLLSVSGAVYGIYILTSKEKPDLREKKILYFILFMVLLELSSVVANVAGKYNLAKTLMVVGFTGAVIAIQFLWTVRLINETLGLVSTVYKHPDRKLFYIDFNRVGEKAPGFFYVFLVLGWAILESRNFYGFSKLINPFVEFLTMDRTLGDYTFTIKSVFVFIAIIAVSTIVSQIISFFAGEPGDQRNKDKQTRKPGIGSWLLLIRIFIISIGVFLAFAAAGIPMDRLTIVLGALGVGIGLGLQGLVSNLVSGLIIAFEKPVNVGDVIEVNGSMGTMKSIGFRSSVINLVDGACMIIPNGDLLSKQLINWTMGRNRRRLNLVVSVAYGSNLKQVKQSLEKILHGHERILQYPDPIVSAKAFQDSAVDFELYFWIGNMKDTLSIKSDVLTIIHETFQAEGIIIPFPRHDLHIITEGGKDAPGIDT